MAKVRERQESPEMFQVPPDFAFPEYLARPCPRPITAEIRSGRYLQRRRAAVWTCLALAGACWLSAPAPVVRQLAWYLLPLGWLNWIGAAFALGTLWTLVSQRRNPGLVHYARNGVPVAARVLDTEPLLTNTSESHTFQFLAKVEHLDPETGILVKREITSDYSDQQRLFPQYANGLEPGDFTTVVYVPGEPHAPWKVWGWTELDSAEDLITFNGRRLRVVGVMTALLITAVGIACAWLLVMFLYVFGNYRSEDINAPLLLGTTAGFSILLVLGGEYLFLKDPEHEMNLRSRCSVWFGLLCVGFLAALTSLGLINGVFDRSPPDLVPIQVITTWQTTYNMVLSTYKIEYNTLPPESSKKVSVSVETLSQFQDGQYGVIDMGKGVLGMRWQRGIHPISWVTLPEKDENRLDGVTVRGKEEGEIFTLVPVVILPAEETPPAAPEPLWNVLRQQLVGELSHDPRFEIIAPKQPDPGLTPPNVF